MIEKINLSPDYQDRGQVLAMVCIRLDTWLFDILSNKRELE